MRGGRRGSVVDASGKPLAGVKVLGKRVNFVLDYMDGFQLKGTTDRAGQFEIPNVPVADYQLTTDIPAAAGGLYTEATTVSVKGDGDPSPVARWRARWGR